MKNIRFVVKVHRRGGRAPEYVQRVDPTPIQMTTNRKLALLMGRFTAEDAVQSLQNSRCCFVSKQTQPFRHLKLGRRSIFGYVSLARQRRLYVCSKTEQWQQSDWRMRFVMAPTSHSTRWTGKIGNSSAALASFPEAIRKARENP